MGPRVRIPPSPPNKKAGLGPGFSFVEWVRGLPARGLAAVLGPGLHHARRCVQVPSHAMLFVAPGRIPPSPPSQKAGIGPGFFPL